MRTSIILAVLAASLCSACGSTRVLPMATPTGKLNVAEQSITEVRDGVAFTVKLDAMSVPSHPMVDSVAAFNVTIDNRNDSPLSFPPQAFVLKDGEGMQYRSVSPEQVREIVSKDTVYLIPYPYVGYYYLKDQVKVSEGDRFSSELPYYAEYHPQHLFTRALPEGPVLGKSKISGNVYFITELTKSNRVDLLLFPNAEITGTPLVVFPFAVEK